ncbi:MAG: glucosyltransferase domain-containing protein [Candidatus Nitrotoga sp.]
MTNSEVSIAKADKSISQRNEHYFLSLSDFLRNNATLIGFLGAIALAAYGFELFNLHLTIDEELHSYASNSLEWIKQGRWGMFLLSYFLFPQPVIPFAPLFIALAFQLLAIVVLLDAWGAKENLGKMSGGAIAMAYPGMVYIYAFSTINFGIGIGLFMVALSVLVFVRTNGAIRLLSALPATLALSIYQGLAAGLAVAFIVYIVANTIKSGRHRVDFSELVLIAIVGILSIVLYSVSQMIAIAVSGLKIGYVDQFFDLIFLWQHPAEVIRRLHITVSNIYTGSASYFGISVGMVPVVTGLAIGSLGVRLVQCELQMFSKFVIGLLCVSITLLPFALGLVMRGELPLRTVVAMPIALAGLIALGAYGRTWIFANILGFAVAFCVFQFVVSTNAMFSSSALALESDRLIAARLLERIEAARMEAGTDQIRYLEVVGYPNIPPTRLKPKSEVIGASFFEWDQGNVYRILLFINTLESKDWKALPSAEQRALIEVTSIMPSWPSYGSVRVFGDTAVVKFGEYSYSQLRKQSATP